MSPGARRGVCSGKMLAVLKCFELIKVPAVHAGAEWAESGKLQPAGGSSFSGTFAAVNKTHGLSGCQLPLLHTRLSQNCHKGQSLIFCGKAGLRSFTSLLNVILQDSACTARHRSSPLLQHGSCSNTRSKIPPNFQDCGTSDVRPPHVQCARQLLMPEGCRGLMEAVELSQV